MSAPLFISLYTPVKVPLWVQITLKFWLKFKCCPCLCCPYWGIIGYDWI